MSWIVQLWQQILVSIALYCYWQIMLTVFDDVKKMKMSLKEEDDDYADDADDDAEKEE